MDLWHPRAIRVQPANRSGGTMNDDYDWRQVGHTTEGGPSYYPTAANYYGHQNWPTSTIARVGGVARICQHFALNRSAYALQNDAGGVDTNRAKVAQFEIGWWTARIHELPSDIKACVIDWVTWVAEQTGSSLTQFMDPRRMTAAEWRSFRGICGHRNVPENDHHDWPGFLNLSSPSPAVPISEDDMTDRTCVPSWAKPYDSPKDADTIPDRWPGFRLMCGDNTSPFEAVVIAYPGVPLMAGLDRSGWRYGDVFGLPAVFMANLQSRPVDLVEVPTGDIVVFCEDGVTLQVAKRP